MDYSGNVSVVSSVGESRRVEHFVEAGSMETS